MATILIAAAVVGVVAALAWHTRQSDRMDDREAAIMLAERRAE